jgi:hypothetical protein
MSESLLARATIVRFSLRKRTAPRVPLRAAAGHLRSGHSCDPRPILTYINASLAMRVHIHEWLGGLARDRCRNHIGRKGKPMLRHILIGLAAATLVTATLVPDDALARRGGGGGARGGGGFHGAAVGGGVRGVGVRGGRPVARAGVRGAAYRGAAWRGAARGAAGAAAVGAGAYYGGSYYGGYGGSSNNCYRDTYGQVVCPDRYQYQDY